MGDDAVERDGRTIRFLAHSPPAPGISGDRIRLFNLIRELKRRDWTVRVWSLVGPAEPRGFSDALVDTADEVILVPRGVSIGRRLGWLAGDTIRRRAFHRHWFWSPGAARAAEAFLGDAGDPVFVEQLFMYPFVPARLRRQVLLDTQNHEAERIRVISDGGSDVARRFAARLQREPVRSYERHVLPTVGRVLAVSAAEAATFESMAPGRVRVVPNGVDVAGIQAVSGPPDSRSLLFLGSLGYEANRDAVRYFADTIAPHLADSDVTLQVVGSNPGGDVYRAATRAPMPVHVIGFVRDLGPYFTSSRAMVVPLRHGAGTRLKILEALAWGLPVVTTSIGGAGLDLINGTHAIIEDDPSAFAQAVQRVVVDDDLWLRLSRAGRALVDERYAWSSIGDALHAAALEVGRMTTFEVR